jgi:hypothetical protein
MSSQTSKPSLWASLLFLHGYVADPQLARRLAGATEPACAPPMTYGEAMRRFVGRGRKLSLRLCQGIGSGLVHMQ